MADIFHDFFIEAPIDKVYNNITTPSGLNIWWTKNANGKAAINEIYQLDFGPGYQWEAKVKKCVPEKAFEFEIIRSDPDWLGTKIGFRVTKTNVGTEIEFYHLGWADINKHYRTSCYCWAMYLRLLKLNLENGLTMPYENRLNN